MRLELNMIDIKDVRFSEKTEINQGILNINQGEIQELLGRDPRLSRVEIALARPGEKCRILQACDVVEPRAKTAGAGEDFPGILGQQGPAGEGSTCVLRGTSVVTSQYTEVFERVSTGDIIDMTGPAAELSAYGKTHNVVVLPFPADGVSLHEYRIAIKMAGLKTAVYLAKAGEGLSPDETEVFELPPLSQGVTGMDGLPKIAYVFQVMSTQHGFIPQDPVIYGRSINKMLPTIMHPNEILDGAVVSLSRAWGVETYSIQNHAVIKHLYRMHGQTLHFLGVIATLASDVEAENERSATMAANLARHILGADGVILTKSGGGAPEIPMALIAQRCEQLGVKTTLSMWAVPADVNDARGGITMFNMPELDALVSMGTPWENLTLPPVERTIGVSVDAPDAPEAAPADGALSLMIRWIKGAQDQLGRSRLRAEIY
jgi:glycine reductase